MQIIPFDKLYNTEFVISEPLAKAQFWAQKGNVYNALGKPKISHTFLWFKNCSGRITDKEGNVLEITKNALAYMAKGTEYRVEFIGTDKSREDTFVIHFQLADMHGEDIAPTLKPIVCIKNIDISQALLIEEMSEEFKNNIVCIPELKAALYKLLSAVCRHQKKKIAKNKYTCIRAGITMLEQNSDMDIREIAESCGVSECYFRKLFKEYSGESPMDFRQHYRIEKAKQFLLSGEGLTIGEIADELNFSDIYHFSKTFKKFTGLSPKKFLAGNEKTYSK